MAGRRERRYQETGKAELENRALEKVLKNRAVEKVELEHRAVEEGERG
jgi:hypothetical protein